MIIVLIALIILGFFLGGCDTQTATIPPLNTPAAQYADTTGARSGSLFAQTCATQSPVICVPMTVTAGAGVSATPTVSPTLASPTALATALPTATRIVIEVTPLGATPGGPAVVGMYTIGGTFINVRRGPGTTFSIAYAIQKSAGLDPFPVYASSGDGVRELWWAINAQKTLWVSELHAGERLGSVQIKG